MGNQNDDLQSRKNITNTWINSIGEALVRLEDHERLMKEGCSSLLEFASIDPRDLDWYLPNVQLKNMSLMLTEFRILLGNVKKILPKKTFDHMTSQLDFYEKCYNGELKSEEGKQMEIMTVLRNQVEHRQWIRLEPFFSILSNKLSKLREELVEALAHLLYSIDSMQKQGEI